MTEWGRIAKHLSREIRKRREAQGMSIEDLSDRCGLTPVYIQQIENGKCDPSLSDVTALAIALECEARDLVAVYDDVMVDTMPEAPAAQGAQTPRTRRR